MYFTIAFIKRVIEKAARHSLCPSDGRGIQFTLNMMVEDRKTSLRRQCRYAPGYPSPREIWDLSILLMDSRARARYWIFRLRFATTFAPWVLILLAVKSCKFSLAGLILTTARRGRQGRPWPASRRSDGEMVAVKNTRSCTVNQCLVPYFQIRPIEGLPQSEKAGYSQE